MSTRVLSRPYHAGPKCKYIVYCARISPVGGCHTVEGRASLPDEDGADEEADSTYCMLHPDKTFRKGNARTFLVYM